MNIKSEFHCIGYLARARGLRGEFSLKLRAGSCDWLPQFQESLGSASTSERSPAQFKIKNAKGIWQQVPVQSLVLDQAQPGYLRCWLGSISDRTAAEAWVGSEVSISREFLRSRVGELPYLDELLNMSVHVGARNLGVIYGFSSNGAQDLLLVKLPETGREIEIPLVSDWIEDLNWNQKRISMRLPEGLIDINIPGAPDLDR